MRRVALLLSCEHGGAEIPRAYRQHFVGRAAREALASHRGADFGALWVAKRLARALGAPLHATTVSRLLVDTNRSEHHPRLFSEWSEALAPEERETVLDVHYRPHRARIEETIEELLRTSARVLHVAVHSFTPALDGVVRNADVGLLYDPRRAEELELAHGWAALLTSDEAKLRVRRNYPYRGVADGLTTALRKRYRGECYVGIELELGQALVGRAGATRARVALAVERTLRSLLAEHSEARRERGAR